MLQSTNKTALRSQKWIERALLDLMEKKDYDKINVAELCRKADLDRRTFYRNYTSKQDVLEQYVNKLGKEYMELFHNLPSPTSFEAIKIFFEFWKQHLSFIQNIQRCGLSDFIFKSFEAFAKEHKELFIHISEEAIPNDLIFSYRIGGFWNVMLTWSSSVNPLKTEEVAAILCKEFQ